MATSEHNKQACSIARQAISLICQQVPMRSVAVVFDWGDVGNCDSNLTAALWQDHMGLPDDHDHATARGSVQQTMKLLDCQYATLCRAVGHMMERESQLRITLRNLERQVEAKRGESEQLARRQLDSSLGAVFRPLDAEDEYRRIKAEEAANEAAGNRNTAADCQRGGTAEITFDQKAGPADDRQGQDST